MTKQLLIIFIVFTVIAQSMTTFAKQEPLHVEYKKAFDLTGNVYSSGCSKDPLYCVLTAPTATASLPFLILGIFVAHMDSNKIAIVAAESEGNDYLQKYGDSSLAKPELTPSIVNAIDTIQLQLENTDKARAQEFSELTEIEKIQMIIFLSEKLNK